MERLKENLEKWSFIEKYRHLDDLCSTLDSIEEGCEHLENGQIIGASVSFYKAIEKLEFLRFCERHGEGYVESAFRRSGRHYLDDYYADHFYHEEGYDNNKSHEDEDEDEDEDDYGYPMDKYLVSIDPKDLSEFSEKFYSCLKHLESIDFSEFDLYLERNSKYAEDLPNGCKEGNEFISLLNVFSDFIKENDYVFVEDEFFIEPLLNDYKDRKYVYVGQVIKDKLDSFRLSPLDNIDLHKDDYDRFLLERRNCFYRFYSVACALKLKKINKSVN